MNTTQVVSVVVIGRNEGRRLTRCLDSIALCSNAKYLLEIIYVDSSSSDDSVTNARAMGATVISLTNDRPCAARGRNAGWKVAKGEFILFLDGDTILLPNFLESALLEMRARQEVAVVWGHRREVAPQQSVYVRVLDLDWIYPVGESEFCGGDALFRRATLEASGGFNEQLIAGEEPELCNRLRGLGMSILHIDTPMTLHDLAIVTFRSYWKRAFRAGHAYAEVAQRCSRTSYPLWRKEVRHHLIRGGILLTSPLLLAAAWIMQPPLAYAMLALGCFVILRSTQQCKWKCAHYATRLKYTIHSQFQHVPIMFGLLGYYLERQLGRERGLIEYKNGGAP